MDVNCPSEFTCSLYADGELAEDESRELRMHLEECPRCREMVERLMDENRLLSRVLQDESPATVNDELVETGGGRVLAPLLLAVFGIAMLIRTAWALLRDLSWPLALGWLNPMDRSTQINLSFSSILYVIQEGSAMASSLVSTAALVAVAGIVVTLAVRLVRRQASSVILAGLTIMMVAAVTPANAAEIRRADTVTVLAGETVDNTLIAAGESVVVDGTINGDLIAFARLVTVRGTVKGDILGFAQTVEVSGTVEGNIFGFGQNVYFRGNHQRNLYGFGQAVEVGNQSVVGGGLLSMAGASKVEGTIAKDAMMFSETVNIHGKVGGNVDTFSERVTVFSGSEVGGNLNATVRRADRVQVLSGSTIVGTQNVRVPPPEPSRYSRVGFYIWQIVRLAAAFLTGLLVFWLVPILADVRLDTGNSLLKSAGLGFLFCVATPIAALILGITIIGLPIALIGLALWILLLYLSKIVIAQFIGRAILGPSALSLLVGLALVIVGVNVPFVGGLVNFLLTLIGFGAILLQLRPALAGR